MYIKNKRVTREKVRSFMDKGDTAWSQRCR